MPTSSASFVIDLHTHIIPQEWPDFNGLNGNRNVWLTIKHNGDGKTASLWKGGSFFRDIESNCWCASDRIKECNNSKVDIQVLSTVPGLGFNYDAPAKECLEFAKFLNNDIAKTVRQNPSRFVGLGTVPMQDPKLAIEELKRCITELGFPGIQIGTHVNEWNLDDENLYPFWQVVQDLDAAVFIHPWDMQMDGRWSKFWFPWLIGMPCETTMAICSVIFGGILDKFPKLRLCFAHGGGSFPGTLGRIEHGFHARPDLCQTVIKSNPSSYLNRIYVDSLVHERDALELLLKKFGADRIILGTDYPFPLGELQPGKLVKETDSIDLETKEKILGGNAVKFLNLQLDIKK